jgi:hypothetical protein
MRRPLALIGLPLAAAATALAVPVAANASTAASSHIGIVGLTGAQEVPGPGDADGRALFVYATGRDRLCYALVVNGIAPATLSHIHSGARGVAGPIVIGLQAPTNGASAGCITAVADDQQTPENAMMTLTRTELRSIVANPAAFYTNVHNADHPAGAIRGQLH